MRASETLYKAGDWSFAADYRGAHAGQGRRRRRARHADPESVQDARRGGGGEVRQLEASKARGVQFVADRILNPLAAGRRGGGRGVAATTEEQEILQRGETIHRELCFSCHGDAAEEERRRRAAMARRSLRRWPARRA